MQGRGETRGVWQEGGRKKKEWEKGGGEKEKKKRKKGNGENGIIIRRGRVPNYILGRGGLDRKTGPGKNLTGTIGCPDRREGGNEGRFKWD